MTTIPPDQIKDLLRLCEAATPGPWRYRPDQYDDWGIVRAPRDTELGSNPIIANVRSAKYEDAATLGNHRRNGTDPYEANAKFVAAARTALPALLQERAGLVERIERLEKALGRTMVGGNHLANILLGKLGGDFHGKYPATLTPDEGLQLIGSNDQYDAWSCWREIILTRVVLQPESKTSWASQIERLSTLLQRPSPMCVVTI